MKDLIFLSLVFLLVGQSLYGQEDFYRLGEIQEIEIEFAEADWAAILDGFYVAGEKERLLGHVTINGERLDSVGIRYKGFSSVSVERKKNPFNIKLDYIKNQNYKGINKIKLSNVIHDPTFVREALSYKIARNYMPAPEANFARVYVNGEFLGLYSNVEAINKDFTAKHFDSRTNAFFKGAPESLSFTGENSNLSNSHGPDTTAYFPYYDMESDNGWISLVEFIQVLNEDPTSIESQLNVDRTLWMHAFNYAVVNLDSYIGYAQNYYLYQDDLEQFNTIPWDMNMSFGSFRITDASDNFDGVSITAATRLDPLAHYNSVSVQPRPLMRKLFENDRYRKMYLAHLRTIMEENFAQDQYLQDINEIQAVIRTSVEEDENKFYETSAFDSNVTDTYADLIEYPGITDLMSRRHVFLKDYLGDREFTMSTDSLTETAEPGAEIILRTHVAYSNFSPPTVLLFFRENKGQRWAQVEMMETSAFIWEVPITMPDNGMEYYFYAENESHGQFAPERAAYEFYRITPAIESKRPFNDVVINELMATQDLTQPDEEGEYDDWIELYNTTSENLNLEGLFLSDKTEQFDKWALPDTILPANDYLIVWADEDGSQGPMHANFKLSSGGEHVYLGYADGTVMDTVRFGAQDKDVTYGRLPNGAGPFAQLIPTFRSSNESVGVTEIESSDFVLYPNPVKETLMVESKIDAAARLIVSNGFGQQMFETIHRNKKILDLSAYASGIYFLTVLESDKQTTFRIIKQ